MAPFRDKPGSAGRPTFFNTVEVVGDLDRPLPIGQVGEIVVRGPGVFKGYWNCDEDTAFTFRNGWHHTGDNGAFDADVADCRVPTLHVIEAFDVIEHISLGLIARPIRLARRALGLQRGIAALSQTLPERLIEQTTP